MNECMCVCVLGSNQQASRKNKYEMMYSSLAKRGTISEFIIMNMEIWEIWLLCRLQLLAFE